MADSAQVAVTGPAAILATGGKSLASGSNANESSDGVWGERLLVSNGGAAIVYLGGPSVSAANGFPLAAGASVQLLLGQGEDLWAVAASGSQAVSLLGTA